MKLKANSIINKDRTKTKVLKKWSVSLNFHPLRLWSGHGSWVNCVPNHLQAFEYAFLMPGHPPFPPLTFQFSSIESLSRVWLFVTPWTAAHQASLCTNSWSLFKLVSIKLVMPSNHLILCRPLLLLPSIFPSLRVFYNESVICIRWPKYWSFIFTEYLIFMIQILGQVSPAPDIS